MQFDQKRREFITLLGGAAATWPIAARAQQVPVVGFLATTSPAPFAHLVAGFRRGLQEAGFFEGRNVAIEYRWAEGRYDQVPALAADLVQRQVAVIVTTGGETSAVAAKAATKTIPIVFNTGTDPVRLGLVTSLARPGGNATGVNIFTTELAEKRLGLLHDLIPAASTIAVLLNPNFAPAVVNLQESEVAARAAGRTVVAFHASRDDEIETAFARIVQMRPVALLVGADPFFNSRREQIVALAARHAIPAIYEWREFAQAGGLMSYGTSLIEARDRPLEERKAKLAKLIARGGGLQYADHLEGDGQKIFEHICKMGLEGIVSKRRDSGYISGRAKCWIKVRNPASAAMQRYEEGTW